MEAKSGTFRYEVSGQDFDSAGDAAMQIKRKLAEMGVNPDVVRRVSVALYEGEINMVIHAGGGMVEMTVFPDEIVVMLMDHGDGIPDVELAMREGYSTATESIRSLGFGAGMGLPNMKRFADELSISSAVGVGTVVTMRFYVNRQPAP